MGAHNCLHFNCFGNCVIGCMFIVRLGINAELVPVELNSKVHRSKLNVCFIALSEMEKLHMAN